MIEDETEDDIRQRIAEIQKSLTYEELLKLAENAEKIVRQKQEMAKDYCCLFCDKKLESALGTHIGSSFQPYAGGEVFFQFCFGSTKFDLNMCGTKYLGYTCDDCAEKLVPKMQDVSERCQ